MSYVLRVRIQRIECLSAQSTNQLHFIQLQPHPHFEWLRHSVAAPLSEHATNRKKVQRRPVRLVPQRNPMQCRPDVALCSCIFKWFTELNNATGTSVCYLHWQPGCLTSPFNSIGNCSVRCHQMQLSRWRSRSNTPIIIWLIEPTKIHYRVILHQNLASSCQAAGNFLIENDRKTALKIKGQGQISPKSNHFYGSPCHIFLPSYINFQSEKNSFFSFFCGYTHAHTQVQKTIPISLSTAGMKLITNVHNFISTVSSTGIDL